MFACLRVSYFVACSKQASTRAIPGGREGGVSCFMKRANAALKYTCKLKVAIYMSLRGLSGWVGHDSAKLRELSAFRRRPHTGQLAKICALMMALSHSSDFSEACEHHVDCIAWVIDQADLKTTSISADRLLVQRE